MRGRMRYLTNDMQGCVSVITITINMVMVILVQRSPYSDRVSRSVHNGIRDALFADGVE